MLIAVILLKIRIIQLLISIIIADLFIANIWSFFQFIGFLQRAYILYVIVKILFSLQNHSERFVFIAEWFDPNASLFRRYELLFYPGDGSVEMVNEPFFA